MGNNFRMIAKTLYGFEPLLEKELRDLGASSVEKGVRHVSFMGDTGFMYKANLCCRTAIKILKPIHTFNVFKEEDLYQKIYDCPWEEHLTFDGTLAVDATVFSKYFTHSQYVALKTKDAIVDRFRDQFGERPNVDLQRPDLRINIHIDRNICTVSLDSSGESLHKRGYKSEVTLAPINEVLAAGLILSSGWHGQCDFLDPMCGSGTIVTEAAMIAANIPPNLNRDRFGFETWNDFEVDLFEVIEASALKRIREVTHKIYGSDKDPAAIAKSRINVAGANLQEFIELDAQDFFQSKKRGNDYLHIVFNPPYDERLSLDDVAHFYGQIGTTLKHGYPGAQAWMITSNMEALKCVGLRPSQKLKVYNGKLESRFVKYELYQGSKKQKNSEHLPSA
ncbi:MAG: THUMP domain-containing protein [Flavobacteriaceae bacterium]|jgi:putative N6-adenine-specific DNA methylase|nr:THUMP domain-containing protein [Flavobacteriaceae bacterium]MDG1961891.1 THUMP domain-containing protein [Flavobacteriaceae bacterium]